MKNKKDLEKMVSTDHTKTQCSIKNLFESANEELKVKFREAYLSYTGMSYPTFYYKMRNNSFRPLEEKAFFHVLVDNPLTV